MCKLKLKYYFRCLSELQFSMKMQSTMKSQIRKQNNIIETLDGPPLDFSFKNIRSLNQLLENMPSTHLKTTIASDAQELKENSTLSKTGSLLATNLQKQKTQSKLQFKTDKKGSNEQNSLDLSEAKLQIVRTIQTTDHNYMETQHKRATNQKEKTEKKVKKVIDAQTTSLFLRYNKLTSIQNFIQLVQPIFANLSHRLMWIDLSHNRLTELSADLGELQNLKTLYLHANYLSSFNELDKIKGASQLRTLTIHANPLEEYGQFRVLIHSILPGLKKIDSTLLSRRETERAEVLMKTMKKYPVIKNPKKPPTESENEQEDD